MQAQNRCLNYLINSIFSGLFVLSFENEADRRKRTGYFVPIVELKGINIMIDGRNFFDQALRNDIKTKGNFVKLLLIKIMTIQWSAYRVMYTLKRNIK